MDRPIHPTAAQQRLIRRVDDRINLKRRDIRPLNNNPLRILYHRSCSIRLGTARNAGGGNASQIRGAAIP
jgi:hypothetical protein